MKLPSYVSEGLARLEQCGFEAYVVGGAVRDELLGRRPGDYDLCTDATVEEIAQVFQDLTLVMPGARFGAVRVMFGSKMLDVTTYRTDGDYADARHPDAVAFTKSLREDLARRDFTINAIAYNPRAGYVDLFGGAADLQARIVRCVGDPAERFSQDALRILRAVRFAARLDFSLEAETELAARRLCGALQKLSPERLRDELSGFIVCNGAGALLLRYREIFFELIPELRECDGFQQNNPNHCYDVLGHIAETVNRAPCELTIRLAALLHDVGKPRCFTMERGRGRFFGHMEVSAAMAREILLRLRYPQKLVDTVCILVENHDKPYAATPQNARSWLGRLGSRNLFMLLKLRKADCLAHDSSYHNRLFRIAAFRREVTEALRRGDCYSLSRLAVNGRDINRALGIAPGEYTGEMLRRLLQCVIDGEVKNREQDLLALARKLHAEPK